MLLLYYFYDNLPYLGDGAVKVQPPLPLPRSVAWRTAACIWLALTFLS